VNIALDSKGGRQHRGGHGAPAIRRTRWSGSCGLTHQSSPSMLIGRWPLGDRRWPVEELMQMARRWTLGEALDDPIIQARLRDAEKRGDFSLFFHL
jgi:hypothetical protein